MDSAPRIRFQEVTKRFGAVTANDSVTFEIAPHSIHGVVGENGAGKSTIMKILYGLYAPDSGQIFVGDERADIRSPFDAIQRGIGMVHQHFMLVPTLSGWQNIVLGMEPTLGKLSVASIRSEIQSLQNNCGMKIDLDVPVENLSIGHQQQIEILKLLYRKARLLILDEPTAVLTPQETDLLFDRLKALWQEGRSIVIITHKLREILALTETVTVLRRGKVVDTVPTTSLTSKSLAELIVGRTLVALPNRAPVPKDAPPVLRTKSLSLVKAKKSLLSQIDLTVHAGEILGIAGVEGNGQLELVEIITQVERNFDGEVEILESPITNFTPLTAREAGIGVIPPDRHAEGLLLSFSVEENFLLGHARSPKFSRMGVIDREALGKEVALKIKDFDIRPPVPSLPVSSLSGGNQQKILIGREATESTRFLIASHPTRGVDIGAIEFIHSHLIRLRDLGCGILLFSSELEEIMALSDRIAVLYNGKLQGMVDRKDATESKLGLWMTGGAVS